MKISDLRYFRSSFLVALIGLISGGAIGYYYTGSLSGAIQALIICGILSILEVSMSFDNAVVNAAVLKSMTPLWQRRFLTWGMLIAVFGMRLLFPLLIVAVVAHLGPIEAILLAAQSPEKYAKIMLSVHHEVAAYGGAFLLLVALKYFFNIQKSRHWIKWIEMPMVSMGHLEAIEVGITIAAIYLMSRFVEPTQALSVIYAGLGGILTYIAVDGISAFLQVPNKQQMNLEKASLGMFLILEVLDASFSFDGVVGAFAITNNLFIICIGLGIGAMFVRSLTIVMVKNGSLEAFTYLEHGAFYAIGALAIIMFAGAAYSIPEIFTGLIGAVFIGLSIFASIREKNKL